MGGNSPVAECRWLWLVSSWLAWLLTPRACSTIPRHYLLSIRFGFLIPECCAWCWTNFSLFSLDCQFLTLDGHVNFPFLPQSRCSNFSGFHSNNFWRLYKSINFLYHYSEAWQMVLKEQVQIPCSWRMLVIMRLLLGNRYCGYWFLNVSKPGISFCEGMKPWENKTRKSVCTLFLWNRLLWIIFLLRLFSLLTKQNV